MPVIRVFNREPALVAEASAALPLFALSFLPMALNLVFTAYFFSTSASSTSSRFMKLLIRFTETLTVKEKGMRLLVLHEKHHAHGHHGKGHL